jgi:isopentenyl-diphosphate delta-isomerase type 1
MKKEEILDLVNDNGDVIGQATRSEAHSNSDLIHRVVHCWIFNSQGQVLLQKRSDSKELNPGCWDMSCGGHFSAGENEDQTLKRELEEELGLKNYKPEFVTKLLRRMDKQTELIYLYYAFVDKDVSEFRLQEAEVAQIKWLDLKAVFQLGSAGEKVTDWTQYHLPIVLQHFIKLANTSAGQEIIHPATPDNTP